MTVKVILYTRNPDNGVTYNFECELARIPTVGEHIWLSPDEAYYINDDDCLKVVYVAHMAFVEGLSNHQPKYSAFIYAVNELHRDAIKASGFLS